MGSSAAELNVNLRSDASVGQEARQSTFTKSLAPSPNPG